MPQPFNSAIMTNSGANLLLRAQFGEIRIEFTRMAIGNGVYDEEEKSLNALQERTELKSEKNSYGLSDIHIHSEKSIKLTALITNQDPVTEETLIEEGYYINEIGLFAKERDNDDSPEALYSIAVTSGGNGDFMPPYNGFNPAEIIQDYYVTVNNSAEVTIKSNMGAPALADDLQALYRRVDQQRAELQNNLFQQQEELMAYTDTEISKLVDSAPENLDTLKEVADAIKENKDVVTALNNAIGTKQSKLGIGTFTKNIDILGEGGLPQTNSICWCQSTELQGTLPYESENAYWFVLETKVTLDNRPGIMRSQKATVWGQENNRIFERIFTNGEWYPWKEYLRADGDLKDTTVTFTNGDDLNPTGWTTIGKIFSGAKLKDMFNGFSTGLKNLRYLWKLCGSNDISEIADGTITGALSQLNTDKVAREWKQSTISFMDCTNPPTDMGIEGFLDKKVIPEAFKEAPIGYAFKNIVSSNQGPAYCALVLSHASGMCGGIVFGYDTYKFTQFLYNRNSGYHGIRFF